MTDAAGRIAAEYDPGAAPASRADAGDGLAPLLAAVAGGDRGALKTVYLRCADRLFGVAMAILRDRDAAADVLQDAFVKLSNRAGQFDPARGAALPWLSGIVRHLALDAARARGREIPSDEPLPSTLPTEGDAFDRLATLHDARRLHACLGRLDGRSRGAILLAFMHGLSHPQVAARLDRPLGTVKGWIRGGLLQLRGCLAPGGPAA